MWIQKPGDGVLDSKWDRRVRWQHGFAVTWRENFVFCVITAFYGWWILVTNGCLIPWVKIMMDDANLYEPSEETRERKRCGNALVESSQVKGAWKTKSKGVSLGHLVALCKWVLEERSLVAMKLRLIGFQLETGLLTSGLADELWNPPWICAAADISRASPSRCPRAVTTPKQFVPGRRELLAVSFGSGLPQWPWRNLLRLDDNLRCFLQPSLLYHFLS